MTSREISSYAPARKPCFEGFLHTAVFAGMEREDGDATAGVKACRQVSQKSVESGKLVIYCDAQRLKNTANGQIRSVLVQARQGGADGRGQRSGSRESFSSESGGERAGVRFIGILGEQGRE